MYNAKIEMVETKFQKVGNSWILTDEKKKTINEEYYNNIVDAVPFFRSLGGYEKVSKNYTCFGKVVTSIISISPMKDQKTERKFSFMK